MSAQRHQALPVLIHSVLVQLLPQRAPLEDLEDFLHAVRGVHIGVVQVLDQLRRPVPQLHHDARTNVLLGGLMTFTPKSTLHLQSRYDALQIGG